MRYLPDFLSLLRIPLAFIFLQDRPGTRLLALILAGISDGLDGYIARRYQIKSPFGKTLDPLADKFFVSFALIVFLSEGRLSFLELGALLTRDISLLIFGYYLILKGSLLRYEFRALWTGKCATVLQFFVLLFLTMNISVPISLYWTLFIIGIAALIEVFLRGVPNTDHPIQSKKL